MAEDGSPHSASSRRHTLLQNFLDTFSSDGFTPLACHYLNQFLAMGDLENEHDQDQSYVKRLLHKSAHGFLLDDTLSVQDHGNDGEELHTTILFDLIRTPRLCTIKVQLKSNLKIAAMIRLAIDEAMNEYGSSNEDPESSGAPIENGQRSKASVEDSEQLESPVKDEESMSITFTSHSFEHMKVDQECGIVVVAYVPGTQDLTWKRMTKEVMVRVEQMYKMGGIPVYLEFMHNDLAVRDGILDSVPIWGSDIKPVIGDHKIRMIVSGSSALQQTIEIFLNFFGLRATQHDEFSVPSDEPAN